MRTSVVVYIAGPYQASTPEREEAHRRAAEDAAVKVWAAGFTVLCPHLNMPLGLSRQVALRGCLELVRRSDAILMLPGWLKSAGSLDEHREAEERGVKVFLSLPELLAGFDE